MTVMRVYLRLLPALAIISGAAADQKPLTSDFVCEHPAYTVQLVSKSPLVIYLHDFLTPQERAHLQDVTYVLSNHLHCPCNS